MYCKKCGAEINDGAKFCNYCGAETTTDYDNMKERKDHLYQDQSERIVYRDDMSVGSWMITLLLSVIPVVNIICLIVWAVSSSPEKRSRKNWAIAQFIWILIELIIAAIFFGLVSTEVISLLNSYGYL